MELMLLEEVKEHQGPRGEEEIPALLESEDLQDQMDSMEDLG